MRFFAFHSADLRVQQEVEADLRGSGGFDWIGSPSGSCWLVAHSGHLSPDRRGRLFFIEGAADLSEIDEATIVRCARHDTLERLPGDFTFACFPSRSDAFFVRSAAGTAPLFVWRGRAGSAVASRLTDLVRHFPEEPRLDPLANAVLSAFAHLPPDGRTPIEDVRLVQSGSVLAWRGLREFSERKWWTPPATEHPTTRRFEEHAHELRRQVLGKLERSLDSAGANLLTLSGGLDSTILAWLAGRTLGLGFSTLSLVPQMEPARTAVRARIDRATTAIAVNVRRQASRDLSAAMRMSYLHRAPRVVWYVGHPALCVLPEVARDSSARVMFGGEYCDEIVGGGPALFDWAYSTGLTSALRHFPASFSRARAAVFWANMRVRRATLRALLTSNRPSPGFLSAALAEEYRAASRDEQAAFARDRSERPYLTYRLKHAGATVQNWEVAASLGVRRVFPFLTRGVVELVFRCHPTELTGEAPKRLVRAAFAGVVPTSLLSVAKGVGNYHPGSLRWHAAIPPELAGIVRDDYLDSPPATLGESDALHLQAMLNIVQAIRTCRDARRDALNGRRA